MANNIPAFQIQKHVKGISDTKRSQVAALQKHIQEILGSTHNTFLQGSYKNDTSISDINDVDIVAVRTTTYSSVYSGLSFPTSISWENIFSEIEAKLNATNLYRWTVKRKDKCIEVETSTFKADIVPAVQISQDVLSDPISIYSFKKGNEYPNYPRTHYKNGVLKHDLTDQSYKPIARMFKNWTANHFGNKSVVSSYQVESLVYNSPNSCFSPDRPLTFIKVGNHILSLLNQRDIVPLQIMSVCGTEDVTANWSTSDRRLFKDTLSQAIANVLLAYYATTVQDAEQYWSKAFNS